MSRSSVLPSFPQQSFFPGCGLQYHVALRTRGPTSLRLAPVVSPPFRVFQSTTRSGGAGIEPTSATITQELSLLSFDADVRLPSDCRSIEGHLVNTDDKSCGSVSSQCEVMNRSRIVRSISGVLQDSTCPLECRTVLVVCRNATSAREPSNMKLGRDH